MDSWRVIFTPDIVLRINLAHWFFRPGRFSVILAPLALTCLINVINFWNRNWVCTAIGIATAGAGGVACAVVGSLAGGYAGSPFGDFSLRQQPARLLAKSVITLSREGH
ncbi:hypothetical protein COO59_12765 [Mixta theicola]|uniref:Uncharacterized protein n=1 Tax=Mixta theicola TaxID=1458355 RepID=A0A2K1Q7Y0_9GAMM|nr:hypothetical protein COO59_12765 [Mixta theicola]